MSTDDPNEPTPLEHLQAMGGEPTKPEGEAEAASATENTTASEAPANEAAVEPPPSDGTTQPFVVIHSNPDGRLFATRVRSTSKGNAIEALNEAHTDNTVLTIQPDVGQLSVSYEGSDALTVTNLSDEP